LSIGATWERRREAVHEERADLAVTTIAVAFDRRENLSTAVARATRRKTAIPAPSSREAVFWKCTPTGMDFSAILPATTFVR